MTPEQIIARANWFAQFQSDYIAKNRTSSQGGGYAGPAQGGGQNRQPASNWYDSLIPNVNLPNVNVNVPDYGKSFFDGFWKGTEKFTDPKNWAAGGIGLGITLIGGYFLLKAVSKR